MELILLEKVTNLGDPGDLVKVKSGYARNFLVPSGKAIYANEENKLEYEKRKKELNKAEEERIIKAKETAEKTENVNVQIPVTVSEEGTLYGSVGTREIAEAIIGEGIEIEKSSIRLPEGSLKELGEFQVDIEFHPEVIKTISVSIISQE
tara:strand:- start:99 stop:548 length:450 start_codon:yes stop_codon:yes gene_type:complete